MYPHLRAPAYVQRVPLRGYLSDPRWGRHCYYCDELVARGGDPRSPNRRTRDHVLMNYLLDAPVTYALNFRNCCNRCNDLRERLGHCCGALMLCVIEADRRRVTVETAAWLLGLGSYPVDEAGRRRQRELYRLAKFSRRTHRKLVAALGDGHPAARRAAELRDAVAELRRGDLADDRIRDRADELYRAVRAVRASADPDWVDEEKV